MHKNVTIGLGLVLVMLVADYCEAGPFGINRPRRVRQRSYVAIPADTIVTTSEQPFEALEATAIESAQGEARTIRERSGTWVRQRDYRSRRGLRGRSERFVWIEQTQPTQSGEISIPINIEDDSQIEQATAIEPVESEAITESSEIIEQPIIQAEDQRRRFRWNRNLWRRGFRRY